MPPSDVKVQERDILAIKANNQNQLMVRDNIFSDPNKISEFILKFYQTNEKNNDVANNFPMYSSTTTSLCDQNMALLEQQLEEAEQKGAADQAKFFKIHMMSGIRKKEPFNSMGNLKFVN